MKYLFDLMENLLPLGFLPFMQGKKYDPKNETEGKCRKHPSGA
jgi:hypothetical protein